MGRKRARPHFGAGAHAHSPGPKRRGGGGHAQHPSAPHSRGGDVSGRSPATSDPNVHVGVDAATLAARRRRFGLENPPPGQARKRPPAALPLPSAKLSASRGTAHMSILGTRADPGLDRARRPAGAAPSPPRQAEAPSPWARVVGGRAGAHALSEAPLSQRTRRSRQRRQEGADSAGGGRSDAAHAW